MDESESCSPRPPGCLQPGEGRRVDATASRVPICGWPPAAASVRRLCPSTNRSEWKQNCMRATFDSIQPLSALLLYRLQDGELSATARHTQEAHKRPASVCSSWLEAPGTAGLLVCCLTASWHGNCFTTPGSRSRLPSTPHKAKGPRDNVRQMAMMPAGPGMSWCMHRTGSGLHGGGGLRAGSGSGQVALGLGSACSGCGRGVALVQLREAVLRRLAGHARGYARPEARLCRVLLLEIRLLQWCEQQHENIWWCRSQSAHFVVDGADD